MDALDCFDESDKEEWRSVMRAVRPDLSDEEFDEQWLEFMKLKREKQLQ